MWNVKYRTEFTDILGVDWRVDILQDGYAGSINTMVASGEPLIIEFLSAGDSLIESPIKGSTATLNIECNTNFQYIDLYSSEDMTYKMKVYYGSTPTLYWQGWLGSDYTEPYNSVPYTVSLVAADGLGLLKYIDYKNGATYYTGRDEECDIILSVLSKIGYTSFTEFCNIYENRMRAGVADTPMNQVKIEMDLFKNKDCYYVLEEILKKYNAIIRQNNGEFVIFRPVELVDTTLYGRIISTGSVTGTSITTDKFLMREGITDSSDIIDLDGGVLMFQSPASKITSNQDYGQRDSWIKNSDFDVNTWDGSAFQNWTITGANVFDLSSIAGFESEKNGVGLTYVGAGTPNTTCYIKQTFGSYVLTTDDVLEFSFDYKTKNATTSDISMSIYMKIKDTAGNIWLKRKTGSESELDESAVAEYITTGTLTIPAGVSEWNTWSRNIIGLTQDGTYEIIIYTPSNSNITLGIRNVVMRATSNAITSYTISNGMKINARSKIKIKPQYEGGLTFNANFEDIEEIVERTYEKDNAINGVKLENNYSLGDVYNTDIDNVIEQFDGALLLDTVQSLTLAASTFATDHAIDYIGGGVVVTSSGNDIIFTSGAAGTDFTGSTTITNVTGDLSGTVVNTQPNVTAVKRKDWISFEGSGEGNVTCDGTTRTMIWDTDIDTTIDLFISSHGATYLAGGVVLSRPFTKTLQFESSVAGVNFTGSTSFVNTDGDLAGVVTYSVANRVAVARVDTITLTGTSGLLGSANILCDGHTEAVEVVNFIDYTKSWNTRGNSENLNLLNVITDELGALYSKGRHFIQLRMMETSGDPVNYTPIHNLQDPINVTGADYKVFATNRATFDVRNREWSADIIEIGVK
jgi:hypothetical protein